MADYITRNKKKYYYTKNHNIFRCEDGHFAYRLYIPNEKDTFVTRDTVTKKKFTTEHEAMLHKIDAESKLAEQASEIKSDITINEIWEMMKNTEGKSAGTMRKHTSVYNHHIKPLYANIKIKDLTLGSIREHLQNLYTVGDGTCGRVGGYSYGFVEAVLKWFYWLYNYSYENRYIEREQFKDFIYSPTKLMPNKVKSSDNKKLLVLDSAEISAIFNLLKGTDLYLPALISLCTGARTGECFALCWSDIDFHNRTLSINKRIVEEGGGILVIKEPKTDQTKRDVNIPDMLYYILYKKRQEQIEAKKAKPEIWAKNRLNIIDDRELNRKQIQMPDFINVDNNGKYIKASAFNPYAKKIREKICPNKPGIEEFSFYTFRKTHISEMATKLTELVLIQHTGHAKVDTIRKYYAARTEETNRYINEAVLQVADRFKWSMAVNSALPVEADSTIKPGKAFPLYTKPKIEIPYTYIPLALVPINEIERVYNEANDLENTFGFYHNFLVLDCATLSPKGCYDCLYDAEVNSTEDDLIIEVNEEENHTSFKEALIEAFKNKHIILNEMGLLHESVTAPFHIKKHRL